MENKIMCPHCNTLECYVEAENNIESYLCLSCGYTTNSLYIDGSDELLKWEASTPLLIKKSKYIDPNTNLVWYPSVLNFPSRGMIFPDGSNEESWLWRMAPVVEIPEEERSKYPIPGKPGEFYPTKIDMESSKFYERHDFKTACEDLGILETKQ
jgi:hypothetical protein